MDEPHGKGKETWKDGSEYEGQLQNGIKHGYGRYKLANGDMYEG